MLFIYWMTNVFFTEKNSQRYLQHKKIHQKVKISAKITICGIISIDQCFVYYWEKFGVLPSTQIKIHPKVTFSAWSTFLCNFYVVAHKTNACHSSFMPSFYNHLGIVA